MIERSLNDASLPVPPSPENSNAGVVAYIRQKCRLSEQQIRDRLLRGINFEIKGEGNDLDSKIIQDVLVENDFYEKASQRQLKQQALRFVKANVEEWSLAIAKDEKKINKEELPNYTAKILAFGSHVLDLKSNSSDIDLICVVPNFVNREIHFFEGLASRLEKDPQVKGLTRIITAMVPIITFDYKEINIDISFCKLEEETIPRDIERVLNMDKINRISDEKSKTSIMGRKNNLMILELVGPAQLQHFKQTLRIIKVWAKNRHISSNAMGFLGGISWAIMLAKVCQIFPEHKPSKLLAQFFNIYRLWKFREMPVCLVETPKQKLAVASEKATMMAVFTPGNHYNSTLKVNKIIFEIIQAEIVRANQILNYNRADFHTLCQRSEFINSFEIFIEIDICGFNKTKDQEKEYKHFLGSVQSKILGLLNTISNRNKKDLDKKLKIVPCPKSYKKNDPKYDLVSTFLIGVKLDGSVDLSSAVAQWCITIDRERSGKEELLNVRVFECAKEDIMADVEIQEPVRKIEKEDPRLALRARRG